jgi:predicted Rossmann fold flavoprotein
MVAEGAPHRALSGLSAEARVTVAVGAAGGRQVEAKGGFLFTHRGYSGPAVLDVAHAVEQARLLGYPFQVTVSFGEPGEWDDRLRGASGLPATLLRKHLPDRLADLLAASAGAGATTLQRLTREGRAALVQAITAFPLPVTGTEGYRTAEVTGGGVALEEVDPGSGASRLVPGLFLAGEILDAFGPIGGFNFQWAWATGRSAGRGAVAAIGR